MTERGRTILQWVLGIGIALGAVKIVVDVMNKPPALVDDTPVKAAPSASASSTKPAIALPGSSGAPAIAVDGKDARTSPGMRLARVLAQIAKDPQAANPTGAQRDQTGLILFQFDLPGLEQPILAVVPDRPEAWAWQFGSTIEAADLTPDGKIEQVEGPPDVATASRLVHGPLAGAVLYTVRDDPKVRVLKSPAFIEMTSAPPGSDGGGPAAPSGAKSAHPRPAPSPH